MHFRHSLGASNQPGQWCAMNVQWPDSVSRAHTQTINRTSHGEENDRLANELTVPSHSARADGDSAGGHIFPMFTWQSEFTT